MRRLHLQAVGICSSKTTRSKLQSIGVEFVISKRQRKLSTYKDKAAKAEAENKKPSWATWSTSHIVAKQVLLGRKLLRAEYLEEIRDLGQIWDSCRRRGEDLPSASRAGLLQAKGQMKKAKHYPALPYDEAIGNNLFGLSDRFACIKPEVLRDEAQRVVEANGAEVHGLEIGWSNQFVGSHCEQILTDMYIQSGDLF